MGKVTHLLSRPRPPAELVSMAGLVAPDVFLPAPELVEWIQEAYLDEAGPLYTPEHAHLNAARLACLWTNAENSKRGRRIVGQAEMPGAGGGDKWAKGRKEQQLLEWFRFVPDFLITLDAVHADQCDDASFSALIDHEITHCAQALDAFGMPKFNKVTGQPEFTLKPHDVQEFVSVVRRFGIQAAGPDAVDMVIAAAQKPEITAARLGQACGTCLARAA